MMITRALSFVTLGFGIAALAGCPIYSDDPNPHGYDAWDCDCAPGYTCDDSNVCIPDSSACARPSDCPAGSTCGADGLCTTDDCSIVGCVTPYVCQLSDATQGPVCVLPTDPGTCSSDRDCATPAGSKCLNGKCAAPSGQCSDATQCSGGAQCVEGACIPSCSDSKPCPTGFACDTARGVCTNNSGACKSKADCAGGNVCVQDHCVPPCGPSDSCQAGFVCVDGGCIPDAAPVWTCDVDGQQDKCREGSICLRHSCYIACDAAADGGVDAGADACKGADTFNVCKSVTTSSGTHSVCGSDKNLGNECDPTQGKACADSLICIDGYCR